MKSAVFERLLFREWRNGGQQHIKEEGRWRRDRMRGPEEQED